MLLAQERVIAILYERTFPVTMPDKVKIDDPAVFVDDPDPGVPFMQPQMDIEVE